MPKWRSREARRPTTRAFFWSERLIPAAPRIQARIAWNSRSLICAWREAVAGEARFVSAALMIAASRKRLRGCGDSGLLRDVTEGGQFVEREHLAHVEQDHELLVE